MATLEPITATRSRAWPFLLRAACWALLVAATAVLLLLALRRLVGGPSAPLTGPLLVFTGVVAALAALVWRALWQKTEPEPQSGWRGHLYRFLPAVALALLAIALSRSGTHPLALVVFWGVLIGEEVWAGTWATRWRRGGEADEAPAPSAPPGDSLEDASEADESDEEEQPLLPEGVSQQITRMATDEGERLACALRGTFAAGQQTETLHVAFCPPLATRPTAACQQLDGPPCDVKVAECETYGARLELKRRGPTTLADEVILLLEVTAPRE